MIPHVGGEVLTVRGSRSDRSWEEVELWYSLRWLDHGGTLEVEKQKDGQEFSDVFGLLTAKTGLTFVAESYSFISGVVLAPEATRLLESAHIDADTRQDGISAVARSFDYDRHFGKNVVVSTKRYSQPGDLPEITFEEPMP